MCGIAGAVGTADGVELVGAMCGTLVHRGPDDQGVEGLPGAVLGMRRLSIIDLAHGHQPLGNEDGSVTVVCNGEIYNHRELRAELAARGHTFASGSDVAVIPHLYEEHGDGFVARLRGMFALALWDARRGRLLLARDRLGKKPLYYRADGERLVFASELKSLLRTGAVPAEVNWEAVGPYLLLNRVPSPLCAIRGVEKLAPAHYLAWQGGRVETVRYWRPSFARKWHAGEGEYLEEMDRTLREAVSVRLMSDVPLGAFLSGGVDSSLVVAMMAREMGEPVETFSIGYDDAQFSELAYARRVSEHLGTRHHEQVVQPDDPEVVRRIVYHLDEPYADASALPTYYVSQLARRHVTVALTGDGADEAFGGYEWYVALKAALAYQRRVPAPLRRALAAVAARVPHSDSRARLPQAVRRAKNFARRTAPAFPHAGDLFLSLMSGGPRPWDALLTPGGRARIRTGAAAEQRRGVMDEYDGDSPLEAVMYSQLLGMLPDLFFVKVDRMSMLHSLEARSPFSDHHVVELAARIPAEWKVRGRTPKYLLRRLAERYLPHRVIHRQKMGFGVPVGRWMRAGRYHDFARSVLGSAAFRGRGLFDPARVDAMLDEHAAGRADHTAPLWTLLCLELWFQEFAPGAGA